MRWTVLITEANGVSEPEVVVQAPTWERALRLVTDAPGGGFAGWSVELTSDGWRIVDPVSRTRYFLRSEGLGSGQTVSIAPPAPAASVPALPTDILLEVTAPKRPLRIPRTSEITMRRAAATKDAPYTYVESGLLVPLGTNEEEAEAALRAKFDQLVKSLAPGEPFRVVLGAFDEYFVGTPHIRAIAELDARSWQPPVRVQFPSRRAATTGNAPGQDHRLPVGGSLPPPPRENADVGPFSIPRTAEAAQAAAADLFLGPARAPSLAPPLFKEPAVAARAPYTPPPLPAAPSIHPPRIGTLAGPTGAPPPMPIVPPPLPSYLATETVALNERLKPATRRGVGSSLWNAEQIRSVPGALDGLALLRAWLEHTALVLEPSFAFVHCFDLAKADFVTVATQGTPAEAAYGIRLKSSDPVLAAALRSSGLVDVPAVRARNALRYKTNEFSTAVSIAMAGAGRVLGVIELAFTAPLQAAQRLELDASVRALGQALDRRGIPLDKLEAP